VPYFGGWKMRTMCTRIGWLLLALAMLATPSAVRAQDTNWLYEVPPVAYTGPLSHPRYENGGLFVGAEFLYLKENRPIYSQVVAVRGFMDIDGSLTGSPRTFVGSGSEALNTNQVSGAGNFQPGLHLFIGWRFENGVTVDVNWTHLREARYSASASQIPLGFFVGSQLAETFLFSPVVNFPPEFAGPPQDMPVGNPGATYGIWNAAEVMQIQYVQRFDMGAINARIPIWQTEYYRSYALCGPRLVTMYDRFWWRTVAADPVGQSTGADVAVYYNTVSNRLYGAYIGCGNDWFLGTTPAGGWACTFDIDGGLYLDLVKGRAGYNLGTRAYEAHRARNLATVVPGVTGKVALWWYPWEAISLQVGYQMIAFFNTVASRYPVDFNFGTIDPQYDSGIFRWLHGFNAGISFVF
jgi:hypothetical protein